MEKRDKHSVDFSFCLCAGTVYGNKFLNSKEAFSFL